MLTAAKWQPYRRLEPRRLSGLALTTHVRLGRRVDADTTLGQVGALLPLVDAKKQVITLADIAGAHVTRGDPDEACQVAAEALAGAVRTECSIAVDRLRDLSRRLQPHRAAPVVRDFDERLHALV